MTSILTETVAPAASTSLDRPRIAFVGAAWHADLVAQTRRGFLAEIGELASVDQFEVPGAFEIPLHALDLARSGRFAAIAAAGLVVDGGIYRHEFVATAVIDGLMHVQLETGVPVFSGVLTPHQFHETDDHQRFFAHHLQGKGRELAQACLQTLDARRIAFVG